MIFFYYTNSHPLLSSSQEESTRAGSRANGSKGRIRRFEFLEFDLTKGRFSKCWILFLSFQDQQVFDCMRYNDAGNVSARFCMQVTLYIFLTSQYAL